jgi:dolichol-phosphate mannosyltransferase
VELSVVVPVLDEEALIPELARRLAREIDGLGVAAEVILVDDGSTDGTLAAIARLHAGDGRFKGLALSRNFGHQAAISAGLAHAKGDAVVVMDGDLQDPPEAIGPLWEKLREGFDVVYAVRASRPEPAWKRLSYRAFYRLLGRSAAVPIPRDAGDFGIMSRRVVDQLAAIPERRRFVRGLRAWVGFRQCGLPIDRAPRLAGRPKYTASKLVSLALDGLVGFSEAPLRWAGLLGLGAGAGGVVALLAATARAVFGAVVPAWAWVGAIALVFGGAQLLALAILGEYVSRIAQEVGGRPPYIVRERIGLGTRGEGRRRGRAPSRERIYEFF